MSNILLCINNCTMEEVIDRILHYLQENGDSLVDTLYLSETFIEDHQKIIGAVKSLQSVGNVITSEQKSTKTWELTDEGKIVVANGSHEALIFNAVPADGISQQNLMKIVPNAKVGFSKAMSAGWISIDKSNENGPKVIRKVDKIDDIVQNALRKIEHCQAGDIPENVKQDLKKRKLLQEIIIKSYNIGKGPDFSTKIVKQETDLTAEMIASLPSGEGSSSSKISGRKMLNPVRLFFIFDDFLEESRCLIPGCKKIIPGNHSGNLEKHIRRWHKDKLPMLVKEKEEAKLTTSRKRNADALNGVMLSADDLKRACVRLVTVHGRPFSLMKDEAFQQIVDPLIKAMPAIDNGSWKAKSFKPYNFNALGIPPDCGHRHPLLKVRTEFRQIFLEMGFTEMPTNNYIESSFWNFDALFQPQQHPARDQHDTFFISDPKIAHEFPQDYLQRVKEVHSKGGYGSQGYKYDWKYEEAQKNLLRTHTTAVSARMLYALAQEKTFKPTKYFSIDRVFRNETLDATHLAEFHQIEGVIADYGLTLGDLIGVLHQFFNKLGIQKLRFKPAYNPYTEPSMEIFCYHEGLAKWVEVGNSGMFRPELLLPMGFPKDIVVIAWGLSLERPTMIKYQIDNIRELVGHKVNLQMVKTNSICRLEK